MKVVVAHNRYRSAAPSGENRIVDTEIRQLSEAGVTVLPFLRDSDDIPTLPATRKALLPVSPLWNPATTRELARLLREQRPDVLHLHNPYPLLSPAVVRTAHRYGVPVVHTVHNYRQVCASGIYFRDGTVCQDCRGRRLGVPAVRHRCYRGSTAQSAIMAATLAAHRPTWRSVERYVALTSAIATHLRSYGIPAERITVKPNAVPDPGPPAPLGDGFLFAAGRLTPEKGLSLLLDAWRRHPDGALGTLRIAGDGEQRSLAERAAADRSDVDYLGSLDADGVRAAMAAAAVVLVTPRWHDVLPTVVIEALAAGRPVLGTDLGGVPYLVGGETASRGAEAQVAAETASRGAEAQVGGETASGGAEPAPNGAEPAPDGMEMVSNAAEVAHPSTPAGWVVPASVDALAAGLPEALAGAPGRAAAARARYESTFHPEVVTRQLLAVYAGLSRQR